MGATQITVCIPTRNRAAFLVQALTSALGQDVDGLEVLVHDDASTDETAELIAGYGDRRIRYLRHRAPIGVAANRNSCLAAARGKYLAWLDSDDERLPDTLAGQLAVLESHPEVAIAHGGHQVINGYGDRLPDWPAPFADDAIEPSEIAFENLIATNELTTSTVVVRSSVQRAAGLFSTAIGRSSTDWEMWLRLALRGAVAYTAAPVARYRQHRETISSQTTAAGERLRCNIRVVTRVLHNDRRLLADVAGSAAIGVAALAAQALLHASDVYTQGDRTEALETVSLAGRLTAAVDAAELQRAYGAGDDAASMELTRAALGGLADKLSSTRFGARIARIAGGDPAWAAQLRRAGRVTAALTRGDAVVAAIAKWDPTLLRHAERKGCNYPDRRLLPDGYPVDGAAAVAHLDALAERHGITHLVVPEASSWWFREYPELAERVGTPLHRDSDCSVYAVLGQ
jgi:glycosyltransferase involved in cell wall biosynthesis